MRTNSGWKKTAALVMSMALVAGAMPANVGGLFNNGAGIVASAEDAVSNPLKVGKCIQLNDTITCDGAYFHTDDNPGWATYAPANPTGSFTVNSISYSDEDNQYLCATDGEFGFPEGYICITSDKFTAEPTSFYVIGGDGTEATPFTFGMTYFNDISLTLGDDLGLNFFIGNVENPEDYTVKFEGGCVETESALAAKDGGFCATAHVYANNMDKEITATLYKGEDQIGEPVKKSVNQYLAASKAYTTNEKTIKMIDATVDFSKAADNYFNGASNDLSGIATTVDINQFKPSFESDVAKLALVLDSKTAVRFHLDGHATPDAVVTDLTPSQLGDEKTVTVDSKDYKFSALSWCYRVLNNYSADTTDEKEIKNINMAKAVVAYYEAAKALAE